MSHDMYPVTGSVIPGPNCTPMCLFYSIPYLYLLYIYITQIHCVIPFIIIHYVHSIILSSTHCDCVVDCVARFSHEYVLMRLHDEFGIRCHVNQERLSAYKSIPSILRSVTPDPKSKFHLCDKTSVSISPNSIQNYYLYTHFYLLFCIQI